MTSETIPLTSSPEESNFYTGQEVSTGGAGTSGISRRVLHGLTILSVLIAFGCTIYGIVEAESAVIILPFAIVLIWLVIHFLMLFFATRDHHEFHPPAWFMFVSSGHIFIQSLVVIILTVFKQPT